MGLKVIAAGEQREIGFRQAWLREAVPLAGVLLLFLIAWTRFGTPTYSQHSGLENVSAWIAVGWFILEIVTAALNPRRRAFHDLIAGTVVVRA